MSNVEAVVLAAGLSSRMNGRNKLLLPLNNRPLIQHVLDNILAAGMKKITVVAGHEKEELLLALSCYEALDSEMPGSKIKIIHNSSYRQGMSTSMKTAIERLQNREEIDAILVFHGDMPFIGPSTVKRLLQMYENTRKVIVVPTNKGTRGHPVLLDKRLFPELLTLTGDKGARDILQEHSCEVLELEVDDPGIHLDIDTYDVYRQVMAARREDTEGASSKEGGLFCET